MVDIAEILDRCMADIQQGRATLASCQAQHPEFAEQLATLLPIAAQLPALPSASLSAEKREAIQAQLLKRFGERQPIQLPRRPQRAQPIWRRLLPVAVAGMMTLGLVGWGVTSASAASLPGELTVSYKALVGTGSRSPDAFSRSAHLARSHCSTPAR